ncbi:MAG: arsenate reductase [Roseivirga sp.]|jgi:arsenate reductase
MLSKLQQTIAKAQLIEIADARKPILDVFVEYCQQQIDSKKELKLNFICTHNSRRSQLSQVWAKVAAYEYGIPLASYSGGVEVTALNERAIASLVRSGFQISSEGNENPHYEITYSIEVSPILAFSKLYDNEVNPIDDFAAIMTCSDADENCPFIPGASARIPLRYEDPKTFDDTPQEIEMYDKRSMQIASEMFYVFKQL